MAKTDDKPKLTTAASIGALPAIAVKAPAPAADPLADTKEFPPEPPVKKKFRVTLSARTPLAHPQLVVEATDEADAKAKFSEANGIGPTIHPWTIEPLN